MKGRKPLPTNVRVLSGNPGKRKINAEEPKGEPFDPQAPIWLSEPARQFWDDLVRMLLPMRVLVAADKFVVAALATALVEMQAAHKELQHGRTTSTGEGGEKTSPYVTIFNSAQSQVTRLLAELGMTPSSRSRVKGLAGGEVDPMDEFLKRGNKKAG